MSILKVHTPQNVILNYRIGNVGHRIVAGLIDLLVVVLYVILSQFMINSLSGYSLFGNDSSILLFILVALPVLFYLPASEYFWQGQTVGKRLLKLRVIREDGSAPSMGDLILRWILRTIDVKLGFLLIFFIPNQPSSQVEQVFMVWVFILLVIPVPLVGIVSMALSKSCQRIGDRVANTLVIKRNYIFSLDDTLLQATEKDYEPRIKNVLKLRDKDIYIIKHALEDLENTRDFEYINKLAEKAKEVLKISESIRPLDLLKLIMRDYDYLAKKRDL